MIRAYLFALDPTEAQARAMRSHCGAARVAYNWSLARVRANWAQRAAERSYGLSGDQLTPWVETSVYGLRKAWNAAKGEVAPWWAENSKETYASGCANLASALANRRAGRARMPRLVGEFDSIVIEDLHVAGMLRNRRLARQIADAGWAEIRRQLSYKTDRAGARLIVADRWFPSSKTCSGCGTAKTKLTLSERTFACLACGLVLDRDLNAARNLAALAAADTGELRREQPDGSDIRPGVLTRPAVALPREESLTQRHHREVMTR